MPNKTPWGPDSPGYPECPVPPGTDCTLWFRGDLPKVTPATHLYNWQHFDHPRDIIAYTDHSAPDQARELHPIIAEVMAEVEKATRKFPTWPTRLIDAGNVVSEEAGELAKACLQVTYEPEKETLAGVKMEAIQTAAMCIRFLASMDRYDTSPGEQHEQPTIDAYLKGAS